jgi:hypothetical protein
MNTRLIISLLCAGALAFACGPRSEAPSTLAVALPLHTKDLKAAFTPAARKGSTAKKASAKIDSRLDVSVANSDIHLALDLRNVGGKHAEITFPSGQTYDFVVVDSAGKEVWRWSRRHLFTQGSQNKILGAGESMEVAETWKEAKPGRYTAIATLRSNNFPVEQRVDFVMH